MYKIFSHHHPSTNVICMREVLSFFFSFFFPPAMGVWLIDSRADSLFTSHFFLFLTRDDRKTVERDREKRSNRVGENERNPSK